MSQPPFPFTPEPAQPVGYQPPAQQATATLPTAPESVTTATGTPTPLPTESSTTAVTAPAAPATPTPFVPFTPTTSTSQHSAPAPVASQTHGNIQRSGFSEDVKTGDYDAYKGTKGKADRLGFLQPRDVTWARVHYVQDQGFFVCETKFAKQGGQEVPMAQAHCCQKLGAPKKRFASLVIHYATNPNGSLMQPFSFTFKVWRFNEQLFDQLRTMNHDFPLEQYDVMAVCTDDKYWKYNLSPSRESVVHSQAFRDYRDPADPSQTWGQQVDAYIAAMAPRLERAVAKINTPQEWAEILGAPGVGLGSAPGGFAPSSPGDAPIESIAQLLGHPK